MKKKMVAVALALFGLIGCGNTKTVRVKNDIEAADVVGKIALMNVNIKYYYKGNVAGSVLIDSIANGETSDGVEIPHYAEFVRIRCEMKTQDTTSVAKLFSLVYSNEGEILLEPTYYTMESSTKITVNGKTGYTKLKD